MNPMGLCQDCRSKRAAFHYVQSKEGVLKNIDICEDCLDKMAGSSREDKGKFFDVVMQVQVDGKWQTVGPGTVNLKVEAEELPDHSDQPLKYIEPSGVAWDGDITF